MVAKLRGDQRMRLIGLAPCVGVREQVGVLARHGQMLTVERLRKLLSFRAELMAEEASEGTARLLVLEHDTNTPVVSHAVRIGDS